MNNQLCVKKVRPPRPLAGLLAALALLSLAACAGTAPAGDGSPAPASEAAPTSAGGSEGDAAMTGEGVSEEESPGDTGNGEAMGADEAVGETMAAEDTVEEAPGEDVMPAEEMAEDGPGDEAMMAAPAWQELPLVDARSGETFTLADFRGQPVFVEPMATWCTNCRQQLENVRAARALAPENAVFVALSVETALTAGDLATYADAAGFDWTFAVMTPEMLQALVAEFGRTASVPPSTPHFVIAADGSWSGLATGIDDPETVAARLEAAQ